MLAGNYKTLLIYLLSSYAANFLDYSGYSERISEYFAPMYIYKKDNFFLMEWRAMQWPDWIANSFKAQFINTPQSAHHRIFR